MKTMKKKLTLMAMLASLSLVNCAVEDTTTDVLPNLTDTTQFSVTDFRPQHETTTSGDTKSIIANFSMPVDQNSLIGAFTLSETIAGQVTDLTSMVTLSIDATGRQVEFHLNRELSDVADYRLVMNQAVRALGAAQPLRSIIDYRFNTGGGFNGDNNNNVVFGPPKVVDVNFVRECRIVNGQEVHQAFIDVQFNEDLDHAPLVRVKLLTSGYQTLAMSQKFTGNMSLMRIQVAKPTGIYKINFQDDFVRDLEGKYMADYTNGGLKQLITTCQ